MLDEKAICDALDISICIYFKKGNSDNIGFSRTEIKLYYHHEHYMMIFAVDLKFAPEPTDELNLIASRLKG